MILKGWTYCIEPVGSPEKIFEIIVWRDVLDAKLHDVKI